MKKGFNKDAFVAYLEKMGVMTPFLRELINNLIEYGLKHEHVSKDQFCFWLSDFLPDIHFGEVAAFMSDKCLTDFGVRKKKEAIADFKIKIKEIDI